MTTLTMQDEKRLDVIQRVYRSELTVIEAALVMGLSEPITIMKLAKFSSDMP